MKFSLRNLALASTLFVASAAFAAETPTVTKLWSHKLTTPANTEARFAAGYDGKIFFRDKANKTVNYVDQTGTVTKFADVTATGPAISIDDAGNMIINDAWPNAGSGSSFVLISADGTKQVPFTYNAEGFTTGRADQLGRSVGDFFSEDGGFMYLTVNGVANAYLVQIKNGELVTDELGYYDCGGFAAPSVNTSTVAQPLYSFDELVDMGDDAVNGFAVRNRSSKNAYYYVDGEVAAMPAPAGANTQEGFDVFILGDVLYQVQPIKGKSGMNYSDEFVIADEQGNIIFTEEEIGSDNPGSASQYQTFNARKVSDNKVELYVWQAMASALYATMYEITLPGGDEPQVPSLFVAGQFQGWDPENATELVAEDGKYTYTFAADAEKGFKISTAKGGWEVFNAGALGASEDNTTLSLGVNEPTQLEAGKLGNLAAPAAGNWTITIDAETKVLTLTGEAIVPEAFYAAGAFQGWDPANCTVLAKGEDGIYTATVSGAEGQFKLSTGNGSWDEEGGFNQGVYGPGEDTTLADGVATRIAAGGNNNLAFPAKGDWKIDVDFTHLTVTVTSVGEEVEPVQLPTYIFVRGDMTDWAAEYSYALTPKFDLDEPVANENGEYEYSLFLDYLFGDFKLGDNTADWSTFNYGANGDAEGAALVENDKTLEAWAGSSVNFQLDGKQYTEVSLTFFYNPDATKASWLKFEGTEYSDVVTTDKAHFAHSLSAQKGENNVYDITFHSTGDAAKAVLVLTNKADNNDVKEVELGEVVKGENNFKYDASELSSEQAYNWAVRIHNYTVAEDIITEPVGVGGGRAGLVIFTDPEYPEVYGKVVVGRTQNGGIDVYDADGNLEVSAAHAGNKLLSASGNANTSSPMDGKARGTEAVMASWGDTSYGVVAFDIANLDAEPYSVFEGVKEANGTIKNGDVAVGSGTPCVAFAGEGDETLMFTFDEDIFRNHLAYSKIGTAKTVGTALVDLGFASALLNTNVGMWGTKNGLFLTQCRADGMDANVYGLAYYDLKAQDITWKICDMAEVDDKFLPSANAGVCINPAGDLLAVSTYTGVEIYTLAWNEDGTPALEKYKSITSPYAVGNNRTNIKFDPANNLYVANQNNGLYKVILADEEPIALTAAHSSSEIQNTSGVENIAVEGADADAAAVYYNLNGVRVNADNLTPGVYVKVVGKTATKVVVK